MTKVQTVTISGQAATGKLGYLFPTSAQPDYASRFSSALENLAEGGDAAVAYLSTPSASDNIVTLGRNLSTPTAIQTPAAQTSDMTILVAAKLPNAPLSAGLGDVGVFAGTMYNSASAGSNWAGFAFGVGDGNQAACYLGVMNGTTIGTQSAGCDVTAAQAQAWGLYAVRITSSSTTVTANVQALTAGTSQTQTWTGTFYSDSGETPSVMLGCEYLEEYGTSQSVELSRAYIWNSALSDADLDAMVALVRADLAASSITI